MTRQNRNAFIELLVVVILVAVPSALLIPAGAAPASPDQLSPADLVVLNGKVLTVDERFSVAEAAAIRDGVFIAVGPNAQVKKWVGEKTRVLDAMGKSVVPGLIESHVHVIIAARDELSRPFKQLGSIAEIQQWVRQKAGNLAEGKWIIIPRNYPTRIFERRYPTRAELDAATDRHPVIFFSAFAYVLNTPALKAAGITRETPSPTGCEIVKDTSGEPTGLLWDTGTGGGEMALLSKYMQSDAVSDGSILDMVERLHRRYNEVGITSINERFEKPASRRFYEQLRKQGRLRVRTTMTVQFDSDGTAAGVEKAIRELPFKFGEGDDWFRIGPLKIIVDGGILLGTAYLREPYGPKASGLYSITDPAFRGKLGQRADQVKNFVAVGHRLGWQLATHVTGDGGVDLVLDAVEAAHAQSSIKDLRFTLIHAYFPNDQAIRRAAALGVCVDTQPAWYYKDADAIVTVLGEERMRSFIGLRQWLGGGVKVAINSDHMSGLDPNTALNPFNPFLTMSIAITRKTEGGQVIGPEQRVSRQDALRMMTMNAAYLDFEEGKKGSIEVGKLGDLAVLSDDFMACDEDRIKDIKVMSTVVGGKVMYERRRQ